MLINLLTNQYILSIIINNTEIIIYNIIVYFNNKFLIIYYDNANIN